MAKRDVTVRFRYRDVFGTHRWRTTTQSDMMNILRNTSITWAVAQNLDTGETKQCFSNELKWKRVPDGVSHWFDDEPQECWVDPDDPGYKFPKPLNTSQYNEAFDGDYQEWKSRHEYTSKYGDLWSAMIGDCN